MKTPLLLNEHVVKQGTANFQRSLESVGGQLYLTNQRLIFESHRLNIQSGVTIVPVRSIVTVEACWTKFLNLIPLLPSSIAVLTHTNQEYRLVVSDRKAWINAIATQRG